MAAPVRHDREPRALTLGDEEPAVADGLHVPRVVEAAEHGADVERREADPGSRARLVGVGIALGTPGETRGHGERQGGGGRRRMLHRTPPRRPPPGQKVWSGPGNVPALTSSS